MKLCKGWHLHWHYQPMHRYKLGAGLEWAPDSACLYAYLLWLGNFYLRLEDHNSRRGETCA